MTKPQSNPPVEIVHIRAGFPGESERIDDLLASTGLRVAICTDIYQGMARLARLTQDVETRVSLRAVVVQVDDLGPAEMEFFTITLRILSGTPVLVYGSDRLQSRVEEALALGATDRAGFDTISQLAPPRSAATGGHSTPTTESAEDVDDPQHDSQLPAGSSDENDDQAGAAVRVPWLKYNDAPLRSAPSRSKPQEREAIHPNRDRRHENSNERRRPIVSEPLLTDEELRALIGDDISSIAPSEPIPERFENPTRDGGE